MFNPLIQRGNMTVRSFHIWQCAKSKSFYAQCFRVEGRGGWREEKEWERWTRREGREDRWWGGKGERCDERGREGVEVEEEERRRWRGKGELRRRTTVRTTVPCRGEAEEEKRRWKGRRSRGRRTGKREEEGRQRRWGKRHDKTRKKRGRGAERRRK